MKHPDTIRFNHTSLLRALLVATCAIGYSMSGSAVAATDGDIEARYQADVARCNAGDTNQDKATCLQEAGAAREESQRHRLTDGNASFDQNQLERCKALSAEKQADCMALMTDPNAAVQGSVESGGMMREKTMTIPATPSAQGPTHVEGVTGSTGPDAGTGTAGATGAAGAPDTTSTTGASGAAGTPGAAGASPSQGTTPASPGEPASAQPGSTMPAPVPGTGVSQ